MCALMLGVNRLDIQMVAGAAVDSVVNVSLLGSVSSFVFGFFLGSVGNFSMVSGDESEIGRYGDSGIEGWTAFWSSGCHG